MDDYIRRISIKISPPLDQEGHTCIDIEDQIEDQKEKSLNGNPSREPVEELSARELEILHMLYRGLSNKEISQELFLSVGTVKWHTSNIYGKLGVRSRTEAVLLARQLKL